MATPPTKTSPHLLDRLACKFDTIDGPRDLVLEPAEMEEPPGSDRSDHHAAPALSPAFFKVPAILLDNQLRIAWQNKPALEKIWHHIPPDGDENATADIFDILLGLQFREKVENWRQWAAFFIQQASAMVSQKALRHHFINRNDAQKDLLMALLSANDRSVARFVFSGRLRQVLSNGKIVSFRMIASEFQQGRLILFEPEIENIDLIPRIKPLDHEQFLNNIRHRPEPELLPVVILAARLNSGDILRTEMPAHEYTRLIDTLCRKFIEVIEQYGGIFGKQTTNGLFGYFLTKTEYADNTLPVIESALTLRSLMSDLNREWTIRKGWLHDIKLNMGIHHAIEYVGALQSTMGDHLITFGDILDVAANLSKLAKEGEIWVTKEVIGLLTPSAQKQVHFGVFRLQNQRRILVDRCFSRIQDLPDVEAHTFGPDSLSLIHSLAVTQIFERQETQTATHHQD